MRPLPYKGARKGANEGEIAKFCKCDKIFTGCGRAKMREGGKIALRFWENIVK